MPDGRRERPASSGDSHLLRLPETSSPPAGDILGLFSSLELARESAPVIDFQRFVPGLVQFQSLLPRVIEAEAAIVRTVLFTEKALSRSLKECLLLAVAAAARNPYCVTVHAAALRALGAGQELVDTVATDFTRAPLPSTERDLLGFSLKLSRHPTWVGTDDIEALRGIGFSDDAILEAVLTTALGQLLCTLSIGLGVRANGEPRMTLPTDETLSAWTRQARPAVAHPGHGEAAYLRVAPQDPETFAPFRFFLSVFGFVPNLFRAQTLRLDVLQAEALTVGGVLLTEDVLTRKQKESILLVVSGAQLNTYCVAVHCEFLRALGVPVESSDQIAVDHHHAGLSDADCALLDVALKLATRPAEFGQADIGRLSPHGFSSEQILEAVVITGFTGFLNTVQMGLAPQPDVTPHRHYPVESYATAGTESEATADAVKRQTVGVHPIGATGSSAVRAPAPRATDEDRELVLRAQQGDLDAFEQLVLRHTQRVYRAIMGVVKSERDAEDGVQETFVKVLRHLGRFQGASRFSTWVTRIAINEGLQILRRRKPTESLDDTSQDDEFRPRNVQAWADDPERLLAREETCALVRSALEEIPLPYRVVVTLQQIEDLPIAEIAEVLDLSVGAVKTRAHRGRLMLREKLAPYFVA